MTDKSLIKQHILTLWLGFDNRVDPQLFALTMLLGLSSKQLAALTGVDERVLRRYISSERPVPPALRDKLRNILRTSRRHLYRVSRINPRNKRQEYLKDTMIALAHHIDLCSQYMPEYQREEALDRYYAKQGKERPSHKRPYVRRS